MIIKTSYDIKGNEYDLTEAVSMIQKGKWNDSIEKISKICNIKLEDAKEIGIKIKNEWHCCQNVGANFLRNCW